MFIRSLKSFKLLSLFYRIYVDFIEKEIESKDEEIGYVFLYIRFSSFDVLTPFFFVAVGVSIISNCALIL